MMKLPDLMRNEWIWFFFHFLMEGHKIDLTVGHQNKKSEIYVM